MFCKTRMIIPVLRQSGRARSSVRSQTRNIWDFNRPSQFNTIMRDFDRQFQRIERDFLRISPLRILAPRMIPIEGIEMKSDSYRLNIDVSGFKPEEIKVSLKDRVLTIKAKTDSSSEDGSRFQQEIIREYTLPEAVDEALLKSLLHNDGILSVEAPLRQPEAPKEIPVESK